MQIKGNLAPIMTDATQTLENRLNTFLAGIPVKRLAEEIAECVQGDASSITEKLNTYINEARSTFRLVEPYLNRQQRMLEVGAGLCLHSLFLKQEGYDITALEPALGGFSLFDTARSVMLQHFGNIPLQVLDCPAQELIPETHGVFDLIFSNNVIEHIPDWQAALAAMARVLVPHGRMLHACPNYTVPYEPHYGVPVFRRFPDLSRRLFLTQDADMEIWESLNFICARDIKLFCASSSLRCRFEKGLLFKALKRIDEDAVFRSRHSGAVASIANLLKTSGLLHLFRFIPPALATPMVIEIFRPPNEELK